MDHNRTSLGSTIDGELKLATQLPKGYMILGDKENFQFLSVKKLEKIGDFNESRHFIHPSPERITNFLEIYFITKYYITLGKLCGNFQLSIYSRTLIKFNPFCLHWSCSPSTVHAAGKRDQEHSSLLSELSRL